MQISIDFTQQIGTRNRHIYGLHPGDAAAPPRADLAKVLRRLNPPELERFLVPKHASSPTHDPCFSRGQAPAPEHPARRAKKGGALLLKVFWDFSAREDELDYERAMAHTGLLDGMMDSIEERARAASPTGEARLVFSEWNLRGWFISGDTPEARHDMDRHCTMADAVFAACFLNACLRHCRTVAQAWFSPPINACGPIQLHDTGLVLRPTYYVLGLYLNRMGNRVLAPRLLRQETFLCCGRELPAVDVAATLRKDNRMAVSLVNRNPAQHIRVALDLVPPVYNMEGILYTVNGSHRDAFNCLETPAAVDVRGRPLACRQGTLELELEPHSVNILVV